MNDEMNDLGKWTWYTAKFLNYCENEPISAASVTAEFLNQESFERGNGFHTWNQATVLMSLYGLFVIPKEFWRNYLGDSGNEKVVADEIIFENFTFETRILFSGDTEYVNDLEKNVFLRRFRNSLAHANFKIDKKNKKIIFQNFDSAGNLNFEVTNNMQGLSQFLEEIGKYFINQISK